jgi:hypothetical protein
MDRLVKAGLVAVFARVRAWMLLTEVRGVALNGRP